MVQAASLASYLRGWNILFLLALLAAKQFFDGELKSTVWKKWKRNSYEQVLCKSEHNAKN